jgi:hypothetical protein
MAKKAQQMDRKIPLIRIKKSPLLPTLMLPLNLKK